MTKEDNEEKEDLEFKILIKREKLMLRKKRKIKLF